MNERRSTQEFILSYITSSRHLHDDSSHLLPHQYHHNGESVEEREQCSDDIVIEDDSTHTNHSESLNMREMLSSFFDELYSDVVTVFEGYINDKLAHLTNSKSLKKPHKDAMVGMLMSGRIIDDIINAEINKMEKDIGKEIDYLEANQPKEPMKEYETMSSRLIRKIDPSRIVFRVEQVRQAIREQLEVTQEIRKKNLIRQFEESYKRQFTESLPSLKVPGQKMNTIEGQIDMELTKIGFDNPHRPVLQNGRLMFENIEVFTMRISKEIERVKMLKELFKELQIHAEMNAGFLIEHCSNASHP